MNGQALTRLLQLASPLLPVGAYSYSQGLEWAIDCGMVHNAETTRKWIEDALQLNLARLEVPMVKRLYEAWQTHDMTQVTYWNMRFLASRETSELRAETVQMGYSLYRLLTDLEVPDRDLGSMEPVAYPTVYAFIAAHWEIPLEQALTGYLWSWSENQVSAAMKTVPLGQVAGQKILMHLASMIPDLTQQIMELQDTQLCNFSPGLAIASSRHETQYSRLFRS